MSCFAVTILEIIKFHSWTNRSVHSFNPWPKICAFSRHTKTFATRDNAMPRDLHTLYIGDNLRFYSMSFVAVKRRAPILINPSYHCYSVTVNICQEIKIEFLSRFTDKWLNKTDEFGNCFNFVAEIHNCQFNELSVKSCQIWWLSYSYSLTLFAMMI